AVRLRAEREREGAIERELGLEGESAQLSGTHSVATCCRGDLRREGSSGDVDGKADVALCIFRERAGARQPLEWKLRDRQIDPDRALRCGPEVRVVSQRAREVEGRLAREAYRRLARQRERRVERRATLVEHHPS